VILWRLEDPRDARGQAPLLALSEVSEKRHSMALSF